MQRQGLFEYAVIRLVPRVEREEFVNVGTILLCQEQKYLDCCFTLDTPRIESFLKDLDKDLVFAHLQAFQGIARGEAARGDIAGLDLASRFRWLTARRSTVLQTSAVHSGLSPTPGLMLEQIFSSQITP